MQWSLCSIDNWFASGNWNPIVVAHEHDTLHHLRKHWHGQAAFVQHGITALPFFLAMTGLGLAIIIWWAVFRWNPKIDAQIQAAGGPVTQLLQDKYGFDDFNQRVLAGGSRDLGRMLWLTGDRTLIDGMIVNGSAWRVAHMAQWARRLQTGYLYDYAIAMIVGLIGDFDILRDVLTR